MQRFLDSLPPWMNRYNVFMALYAFTVAWMAAASQSLVFGDRIAAAFAAATQRTHEWVLPQVFGQSTHYTLYLTPEK